VQEVASRLKVASAIIQPAIRGLVAAGMVAEVRRGDEHDLALTPAGTAAIERLTEARRSGLTELLDGWNPREHPEVIDMVKELASALMADDKRMVEDALPSRTPATSAAGVPES
jgi:DNA-binding MarR family transcriptional regulator